MTYKEFTKKTKQAPGAPGPVGVERAHTRTHFPHHHPCAGPQVGVGPTAPQAQSLVRSPPLPPPASRLPAGGPRNYFPVIALGPAHRPPSPAIGRLLCRRVRGAAWTAWSWFLRSCPLGNPMACVVPYVRGPCCRLAVKAYRLRPPANAKHC